MIPGIYRASTSRAEETDRDGVEKVRLCSSWSVIWGVWQCPTDFGLKITYARIYSAMYSVRIIGDL